MFGLARVRKAWWEQSLLEPYLNTWRYVLLLEKVEEWNLQEGPAPPDPSGVPGRILVVQLEHLGNLVHTTPLLRELRKAYPDAEIDLVVGPWCADVARCLAEVNAVFEYCPHMLQLHRGNTRRILSWKEEIGFLRELRDRRYDLLITCGPGTVIERLIVQAARPGMWLGTKEPEDPYPDWSQTATTSFSTRLWEAERLLRLLQPLNIYTRGCIQLYFPLDENNRRFGRQAVSSAGSGKPVVVLAPGAGWSGRVWRQEAYTRVAQSLANKGIGIVVLGGEDARQAASAIAGSVAGALNLVGRTSIFQAAGVIAASDVFVGSDSGLLHVAAAVGTATVGLFGPAAPHQWAPRGKSHVALRHVVKCRGCLSWHPRSRCRDGHACMAALSADEVLAAVLRLLYRPGSS